MRHTYYQLLTTISEYRVIKLLAWSLKFRRQQRKGTDDSSLILRVSFVTNPPNMNIPTVEKVQIITNCTKIIPMSGFIKFYRVLRMILSVSISYSRVKILRRRMPIMTLIIFPMTIVSETLTYPLILKIKNAMIVKVFRI